MLEEAGYIVGYEGKGWGPGDYEAGGRMRNPGGEHYNTFEEFYNEKEKGQPFCYWYSSRDPHRPFKVGGWEKEGIQPDSIIVPPYLPDCEEVRKDIGDYYAEIQNFDRDVASYIQLVKEMGQLENTLVIVCSDNGWQMPRGLANLYDFGTRIPLIISMPEKYKGGRVVTDFVSLNDFAPTFLELAGLEVPNSMNARSFVNILESEKLTKYPLENSDPRELGGDIITLKQYQNFELYLEWKIGLQSNSGVFIRVLEGDTKKIYETGPEYQLLDDKGWKKKISDNQYSGANYAMHAPLGAEVKPIDQWNTTRIVVNGSKVQHYLNGKKVVEYELWTEELKELKNNCKWKNTPLYGMAEKGHIGLQDHGGLTQFRNVKIRDIDFSNNRTRLCTILP
jgi:hypothetical protein